MSGSMPIIWITRIDGQRICLRCGRLWTGGLLKGGLSDILVRVVLLGKEPKGGCSFLSARKKRTKESTHPTKASPRGEDATAPPVALTLR